MTGSSSLGYIHEHVSSHPIPRRPQPITSVEVNTSSPGAIEYIPSKGERLVCCGLITTLVTVSFVVFTVVILRSPV